PEQVLIVLECCRHVLEPARTLDEHLLVGVDEDIAHGLVAQERLQGTKSKYFVEDIADDGFPLADRERNSRLGNERRGQAADFRFRPRPFGRRQLLEVQLGQQLAVNRSAHFEILGTPRIRGGRRTRKGRRWVESSGHSEVLEESEKQSFGFRSRL